MDLFTLDQAKTWLGIDPDDTDYDDRLAEVITATRTIVETRTGTLGARTEVYTYPFDTPVVMAKVVLPHYPITAVTKVEVEGQEITADAYRVYPASGIVRFRFGLVIPYNAPADALAGDVTITYTVGSDDVSDNVALAAKIITQDLWQTQMIQMATGAEPTQPDPARYLMPRRALLLLPKRARFA